MLDLQDIKDYLYCSLLYYLKRRPMPLVDEAGGERFLPAYTTLDLPGLAVSQALSVHATGEYHKPFPDLVRLVWQAWFAQKGVGDDVAVSIQAYAKMRNKILEQFLSGKIRNPENKPYTEPRMTARYKGMLDASRLKALSGPIDEAALAKLGCIQGELAGMGPYPLAEAYADSVLMASRYEPPLPGMIYGVKTPTLVLLPNGSTLSATADLVLLEGERTVIEVHDAYPAFYYERGWVGRRLEVIAALEMGSADPDRPFPKVERVVYRHWLTGKTLERRRVRLARLVFSLDAARRGIEAGIFTPQFLSGDLSRCRGCRAREICIPASGDISEWFLPGEAEIARRVQQAIDQIGPVEAERMRKLLSALDGLILPAEFLYAIGAYERMGEDHG
jgi:hypothetical protein